ncbi:response regulator transcription factor [Brumicola nitratireducens]|uniref:Two-component response regulator n=1 Tax=Glaciecola nitratireducens (strain JCM 12485 / KCTC 12276 / FR1064) TaxID=1085623 RepID=G4QIE8_GLANF|nr:response regulator transcription factor [Glaciecola nitratireducens]AEP30862.1 two-component response regulator [Glaciecola nitratireducens FR1064]
MKILIIEDDLTVAGYISKGLEESGHTPDVANDGKQGLLLATTNSYDVIVLDRMLPHIDGITILNTIRDSGDNTPAVILSAKNKVEDKVKGLRSGAADYMTKPFAFEELLARIEIVASRQSGAVPSVTEIVLGELKLDLINRQVTRNGTIIDLQSKEFKLLEYLLKNKGKIVTRTMLLEKVWEYNFDPQTNVIDVHISRLRNKIDKGFSYPIIETIRGAGYLVSEPKT